MDLNAFTYMAFVQYKSSEVPIFYGMSHVQARRLLSNTLKSFGFDEPVTLPTEAHTYNKWDRNDGVTVTVLATPDIKFRKGVSPLVKFRERIRQLTTKDRKTLQRLAEQSGLEWRGEEGRATRKLIQEIIDGPPREGTNEDTAADEEIRDVH